MIVLCEYNKAHDPLLHGVLVYVRVH